MGQAYQKGMILYRQRRYRDAVQQFREALAAEPQSTRLYAMLALSLLNDGQPLPAHAVARDAIQLNPDDPFGHYAMSFILPRVRTRIPLSARLKFIPSIMTTQFAVRTKLAMDEIKRAIELDPHDPDYFAHLSFLELRFGKWRASLKSADAGLKLNPNHIECTNRRAFALMLLGRRREAAKEANRALAINPEYAPAHSIRGQLLMRDQQWGEAEGHFRDSLRIDPDDALSRHGLRSARTLPYFFWYVALPACLVAVVAPNTISYCHDALGWDRRSCIPIFALEFLALAIIFALGRRVTRRWHGALGRAGFTLAEVKRAAFTFLAALAVAMVIVVLLTKWSSEYFQGARRLTLRQVQVLFAVLWSLIPILTILIWRAIRRWI
jgi:tetratricopeptide (TPR) repeat protein